MMPNSHQQALYFLLGAVGLLFFIIIGTVVLSQFRKKSTPLSSQNSKEVFADEEASTGSPSNPLSNQPVSLQNSSSAVPISEASVSKPLQSRFFERFKGLFSSGESSDFLESIEEILYTSDLGPGLVQSLIEKIESRLSKKEMQNAESVKNVLKEEFMDVFNRVYQPSWHGHQSLLDRLQGQGQKPCVIMMVGINGAGKTTSIGKIAAHLASQGGKVLVAAGDTFRAAAGSQLQVWSERAQVEIFSPEGVTDPSAVAFDAVSKAKVQNYDYVIIDTAGRLHTQVNLMEELKKMKRVMTKVVPEAPHEILLVIDANQGQNALIQAKEFHQALGLTGAILTKMDGSAKGGVAVGLVNELQVPIKMMGVGEKIQDIKLFQPEEFVSALLEL